MNPLIQLKRTTPMFLVSVLLACFGLSPQMQAVSPPPDGGYPGGNTAEGQAALLSLTTGGFNTAVGYLSLRSDTEGIFNTAVGAGALLANVGADNTATGAGALLSNSTGVNNTAVGVLALFHNTTGQSNTAVGSGAVFSNTNSDNTAVGFHALFSNAQGSGNTAMGSSALSSNTDFGSNTAIGYQALLFDTTGFNNTALGAFAGNAVTTASNVICIGSLGANADDSTWIGNIYGVTTQSGTTAPVVVSDGGQLGTVASSERFKKDINAMEKASEALLSLRPVTFHYKTDSKGTPQFGLIAEEVAKVNPALVLPDKEGKPYTVRYDAVNAMLLNEFLKEHRKVAQMEKQIEALTAGLQKVSAQIEMSKPATQTVLNNQ
jgi:Chaperone of endosialidase